jgi:hypothetical protein
MMSVMVAMAFLAVSVVIARAWLRRRDSDGDRSRLGTVSEQWLLVHKGEDR